MGKWIFISILLVAFSGLAWGSSNLSSASRSSVSARQNTFIKEGSRHTAQPPVLAAEGFIRPMLAAESNFYSGHSHLVSLIASGPAFVLRPRLLLQKQARRANPVLKDHFHHLFPFYHFW